MRFSGRVINGRIEIEDETALPEGASVEVMISDAEELYTLTEDEEHELWEADQEIERGEFVTAEQLLAEIRLRRSGR